LSARPDVVVVGGGVAGITAALRLAENGARVQLLESRRRLGGRATSFADKRTGQELDNCQHVVLGCCTNYIDLCARLGVSNQIQWHDRQYWFEPGGRESIIGPWPLPAPAHQLPSFLRARFLSMGDKIAIMRALRAMHAMDRADLADRTFADLLADLRQPASAVGRFWEAVVVSACNLPAQRVAAPVAVQVFQQGFLANRRASRIGVPRVPLARLYERAREVITAAGGCVRLGAKVDWLDARSVRVRGADEPIHADRVICAVPFERLGSIVDESIRRDDPRFDRLSRLTHSPILGVHLWFDRPVLRRPHAVLVERGTQWLFRKDESGRRLHAVVSAADGWMGLDESRIVERVVADIGACIPGAGKARLEQARAVKERRATFAPVPGVEAFRPGAVGPDERGLVLAGDYTATGWPATMEGAARSGTIAAAAVLGRPAQDLLVLPLKVALGPALLGLCQRSV